MNMTGLDKDIFRATRRLTTLLNEACNYWNYLCPYLENLGGTADRALEGYRKDYPSDVDAIIAEDRKSAISPIRNCDVGTAEEQAERYSVYCKSHKDPESECLKCPLFGITGGHCELAWAQLPYESEVSNG